jgi:roadblock/LC7 domain-containing protein
MSDIFLSYASADRDRARQLAELLERQGWSVWWDRTIPPGSSFDQVIEQALASARCVVVLWSKASVASDWVKTEAAEGARKRILVPALIEGVKIPFEFRRLQAADLSGWQGETAHPELRVLFGSVADRLGRPLGPLGETPSTGTQQRGRPRKIARFAAIAALILVFGGAIYAARRGKVPLTPPDAARPPTVDVTRTEDTKPIDKAKSEGPKAAAKVGGEERKIALALELSASSEATRMRVLERAEDEGRKYWWYLSTQKGRADLLQLSVLLAVESLRRSPSPEAEQALRRGLVLLTRPARRMEHAGDVAAVVFSPDGKYVATASSDDTARVWEAAGGREVARMNHAGDVRAVAFSPDGRHLATGSDDKTARVWEALSGLEIKRMSHEGSLQAVVFSPDGKYLATREFVSGLQRPARVWEISSGREVARLTHAKPDFQRDVEAVAFSPDGKSVASGGGDETARVWEVGTWTEHVRISQRSDVQALAYSPDGRYLASGNRDGSVRLWPATGGTQLAVMTHDDGVWFVTFSPNGKYLVSVGQDMTARVWEATTGQEIVRIVTARFSHHSRPPVAFSPDGRYLATAGDPYASLWLLFPENLMAEACARMTRNLTPEEWRQHLGDEPYRKTCPTVAGP